jgi:hypothetical protein
LVGVILAIKRKVEDEWRKEEDKLREAVFCRLLVGTFPKVAVFFTLVLSQVRDYFTNRF